MARVSAQLEGLQLEQAAATWTQLTYITTDTQLLNARANDRYLAALTQAIEESRRFDGQQLQPATARALMKLRLNVPAPAPHDPQKRARMTTLGAGLDAKYGQGKYCPQGPASCKNLDQLSAVLAHSRNFEELTAAWKGWHDVGAGMRSDYAEFVALANEGAREQGFKDLGVMWRSGYDMAPEAFEADTERLWKQVKPLYDSLHCYARARLARHYGASRVPAGQPIPAQLLGNMWAQDWGNLYPDLLIPYPQAHVPLADAALKAQKWDAARMTHSAESFYVSLGFPEVAADLLGALDAYAPARPRGGLPPERLGHGPGGCAREGLPRAATRRTSTRSTTSSATCTTSSATQSSRCCSATAPTMASTRRSGTR